MLQIPLY